MGTRGAYGFHRDGVDKLTYNHYDSYPDGLGEDIVKFCRTTSIGEMHEIFDRIIMVDNWAAEEKPSLEQIEECKAFYDSSVGFPTEWYSLLRHAQGDMNAFKQGLRYMIENSEFMKDSLFCEWAYIINLSTEKLEVYRGFQKEPQKNRYYLSSEEAPKDTQFFNVALLVEFPLEDIPDDWKQILEEKDER